MALVASSIRNIFTFTVRRNLRSIMTSASRCEKVLEDMKASNPYYEKYAEKIAKLQQTSPEELLARLEQHQSKERKAKDKEQGRNYSQLLNPKEKLTEPVDMKNKSLNEVMKVELIKDKSAAEIEQIWNTYHKQKTYVAATVPAKDYEQLQKRGLEYPIFLFPLPRSQGYEFIMCEFQGNTIHFTPLLYYQVHKENAPECLTLTYYTEFMDEKGIVLMRGEFDDKVVDSKEALCLANQLLLYYGQNEEEKLKLLEMFNRKPEDFKHMDLIKQIENLSL